MIRYFTQILTRIGHQLTRIGQFDWIFEPRVPTFAQRFRAFFHRILMRLRRFNAIQRALCCLRGHLYDVVQTIACIRNRFGCFGNRLIQAQLA
ncbi:hypothetical protein D3C80_1906030 [compost metagenome]